MKVKNQPCKALYDVLASCLQDKVMRGIPAFCAKARVSMVSVEKVTLLLAGI